jgi:hypothetical protein
MRGAKTTTTRSHGHTLLILPFNALIFVKHFVLTNVGPNACHRVSRAWKVERKDRNGATRQARSEDMAKMEFGILS